VFNIVAGTLLLPSARLADIFGPRILFICGIAWSGAATISLGFVNSYEVLVVCRALHAIGVAGYAPAGVSLLGTIYRPGPRKNIVFGVYGALAPLGFFIGILLGGLTTQYLNWRWYFWIGAAVIAVVAVVAFASVPHIVDQNGDCDGGPAATATTTTTPVAMDWWGLVTLVPGLGLLGYALTDCATAPNGFATPYIIVTLVLGVLLLGAAVYVEGWVAVDPLLPPSLFQARYMKTLCCALFLSYGVYGIYMFYSTF